MDNRKKVVSIKFKSDEILLYTYINKLKLQYFFLNFILQLFEIKNTQNLKPKICNFCI
jgi:hypothetical protein